jgi:hypothetical protein
MCEYELLIFLIRHQRMWQVSIKRAKVASKIDMQLARINVCPSTNINRWIDSHSQHTRHRQKEDVVPEFLARWEAEK